MKKGLNAEDLDVGDSENKSPDIDTSDSKKSRVFTVKNIKPTPIELNFSTGSKRIDSYGEFTLLENDLLEDVLAKDQFDSYIRDGILVVINVN